MPSYALHLSVAFVFFLMLVGIVNAFHRQKIGTFVLSLLFVLLGSEVPDIDQRNSLMRRFATRVVPFLASGAAFILLLPNLTLAFVAALILAPITFSVMSVMPLKHRGNFHKPIAALVFSISVVALLHQMIGREALVVGLFAGLSYLIHIALDKWASGASRKTRLGN